MLFDQRSKGFIWFFSFLVWFDAIQSRADTEDALVLLLDEPAELHALAKVYFGLYRRARATAPDYLYERIPNSTMEHAWKMYALWRIGSKKAQRFRASWQVHRRSLFPLQAAPGYSIAQNLFIAKKNVLIEGPADLILVASGRTVRSRRQTCTWQRNPGAGFLGGLENKPTFVALRLE